MPAGHGTEHPGIGRCKRHGGSTPNHVASARKEIAKRHVATYGLPTEIDPHAALLEELHRTAGHVAWLGLVIAAGELPAEESPTGRARTIKLDQDTIQGQTPSVWLQLYHQERQHYLSVAKACIAAGIEERRVKLAEDQGQLVAELFRRVIEDPELALPAPQRALARTVVARHLRLLPPGS